MNDIKLSEMGNIDYIPEDRSLCAHCVFYDECPYDHECPSLIRLMEYEAEHGEL